ncbi:MAG: glycosyltransferase family 2 protein [Pseudomonadota bacterium]
MNLYDPQLRKSARRQATPVSAPGPQHVAILMGVHNGARWLPEQLESLVRQTHKDWALLVGDDRSTDDSADIIHHFAQDHPNISVRLLPGPNKGFQANFLSLLQKVPSSAAFVAFADQDDVWKPAKLTAAIASLSQAPEGQPALYCGRTDVADAALNIRGQSPHFARAPSFENALVQSLAGGNTMVMNRAAVELLRTAYDADRPPVSHDWWAYQIISGAGGHIIFDPDPKVIYRQHSANLVGSGMGLRAKLQRLARLLKGDLKRFSDTNIRALQSARRHLTDDAQRSLDHFVAGRTLGFAMRIWSMRSAKIYRQTFFGSLALWAAVVLARI